MRILITGARGFVGSVVTKDLMYDYSVFSSDITKGNLKLDVTKYKKVLQFFLDNKFGHDDLVIHLAARAGNRPSYKKPREYLTTNILGTLNVVHAMYEAGIEKLIFLSAWNVLGRKIPLPFNETDPVDPDNPYGLSKAVGENIVKLYTELYNIKAIVLRPAVIYGPYQKEKNIIQQIIDSMISKDIFEIYCKGKHAREFLYVEDIPKILRACIKYYKKMYSPYELFIIGTEKSYTINETVEIAQKIAPFPVEYKTSNVWCFSYLSDMTKAKTELNIDPNSFVDINEGIKKCYVSRLD